MAILYVDDGGSNTSPFDTWAKACTTGIAGAMADGACVAGSTIYVGHNSVYTAGGVITYTNNGTIASPIIAISADNTSGEPPTTYTTGAIEDSGIWSINFNGVAICYGVTFRCGDDFVFGAAAAWKFEDCVLDLSNAGDDMRVGADAFIHLVDSDIALDAASLISLISDGATFLWDGGALITEEPTSTHIWNVNSAAEGVTVIVRNVDLSIKTGQSGTRFLFNNIVTGGKGHFLLVEGCLLNADPPGFCKNAITGWIHEPYKMIGCHSADTPYFELAYQGGVVYHDSAIYRAGADPIPNNFSIKIVTAATYATYHKPLRHQLGHVWCAANPTITIEATHDSIGAGTGGLLENDEYWIEIEYPDGTNQAYRKLDQTLKAGPLATPADQGSDAGTSWTGTGGFASAVEQRIARTISGGGAGLHTVWICFAVPSTTVYVCPQIDVT